MNWIAPPPTPKKGFLFLFVLVVLNGLGQFDSVTTATETVRNFEQQQQQQQPLFLRQQQSQQDRHEKHEQQHRFLSYKNYNPNYDNSNNKNQNLYTGNRMVDSRDTIYNEYSQAYRMLGLYIDCGDDGTDGMIITNAYYYAAAHESRKQSTTTSSSNQRSRQRHLEEVNNEEEVGDDNEGEENDLEQENNEEQQQNNKKATCQRYLLWAAYVDLNYEGNGLNEYQMYDTKRKRWDTTMCQNYANSNIESNSTSSKTKQQRCAKMDCHLSSTHYKLLGFYREEYPLEFLSALSNHQGTCSWDPNDKTLFDEDMTKWLPNTCTQSTTAYTIDPTTNSTQYLYFDLQPKFSGGMSVGLYTDSQCIKPHNVLTKKRKWWRKGTNVNNNQFAVGNVLNAYYGYDSSNNLTSTTVSKFDNDLRTLNDMLSPFKVCQPCRTYNMSNVENNYACSDSSGYEDGVNMCSIFATTTQIQKATFNDVTKASIQASIVPTYTTIDYQQTFWQNYGFLFVAILLFVFGILLFCTVAVKRKRSSSSSTNRNVTTTSVKRTMNLNTNKYGRIFQKKSIAANSNNKNKNMTNEDKKIPLLDSQ